MDAACRGLSLPQKPAALAAGGSHLLRDVSGVSNIRYGPWTGPPLNNKRTLPGSKSNSGTGAERTRRKDAGGRPPPGATQRRARPRQGRAASRPTGCRRQRAGAFGMPSTMSRSHRSLRSSAISNDDWLKVHAMVGCKTNAVVAIEITPRNGGDAPQFAPLLETTTKHFNPERVLGDKAYSSYANVELAERKGIAPVIPFRARSAGNSGVETWDKLFHFYSFHREQFLRVYHQRSNVESTFSAIKRKFGEFLRSKTPVAQINELLLKFVAHNVVCVIHSMHELGINPAFRIPGCHHRGEAMPGQENPPTSVGRSSFVKLEVVAKYP
ncbi:MAG: transposase [Candidatus Binatia bacterium]